MKRIVLTGGGTAGHVTPNIALLPHLKDKDYDYVKKDIEAAQSATLRKKIVCGSIPCSRERGIQWN